MAKRADGARMEQEDIKFVLILMAIERNQSPGSR